MNVRVNAVAPGEITTEMIEPEYEMLEIPRIPLNRMGTPDDTARTIYYLASEEAAYITGAEIWVTGGQHVLVLVSRHRDTIGGLSRNTVSQLSRSSRRWMSCLSHSVKWPPSGS